MLLKLATYNIHRCIGRDRVKSPERIRAVIEQMHPDILALQEVEYVETIQELGFTGGRQEYQAITGPTVTSKKATYGNMLLTRHPVAACRKIDLSYPGREQRGAIDVDINCGAGVIRVLATHLGLAPVERRAKARTLLAAINDPHYLQDCTVLMGDINEWFLWGRPLRWIHRYFGHSSSPPSYPAGFPLFSLDKIWCHPAEKMSRIRSHKTRLSRAASDHLPLWATLSF